MKPFLRRLRGSSAAAGAGGAGGDTASLLVTMMIAADLQSPMVLQMDILGVDVGLEVLLLEMDILESVRDVLLLTMDIVPQALRTSVDNQAPVAAVTVS